MSLLYRFFGIGKIPADHRAALAAEGIVLSVEGVGGSATYRNFRSPQRIASWRKEWLLGSLVLTNRRIAAFRFSSPVVDVALADERLRQMRFSVEHEAKLKIAFDAALFHDDWSGSIEYRFKTPSAAEFLEKIRGAQPRS